MRKIVSFGAGPAPLPIEVLQKIQDELVYNKDVSGISILETSHRSADFNAILKETECLLRELMNIPNEYAVLFMHGGGSGQFAALPLNLQYLSKDKINPTADYMITGTWSNKAAEEAQKYIHVEKVFPTQKLFTKIPDKSEWKLHSNAAYVYYCANETIHGIEFKNTPEVNNLPLIADISSNILSCPFDVSKHTVVIAGTQKNLGIAGLCIAIVKKDVLGHAHSLTPSILNYDIINKNNSLYNTPPTFNIYVTKLILEWIRNNGGAEKIYELNRLKSSKIYDIIDFSNGFYSSPIDKSCRSQMNIPFRIGFNGGNEKLELKFLELAQSKNMLYLKGHRSVGGIRASLYNAITFEETEKLAELLQEFKEINV